jgi:diguanylate cyclase (GGDEF)-like protein
LRKADLDDLTGAYRRGTGTVLMRHEIERARRSGGAMVLAFIDLDDLGGTNKRNGHSAGDSLLVALATALRNALRPYDPLVRWGGDEFVCGLLGADLEGAHRRLTQVAEALAEAKQGASFSYGAARLEDDDVFETLLERADQALLRARNDP